MSKCPLAVTILPGWAQIIEPPQPQIRERIVASPRLSVATRPHLAEVDTGDDYDKDGNREQNP